MIRPKTSPGLVAFSHKPILSFSPIILPDGTRPVPKHFDLAAQPHQDVLDRQKEKFDTALTFLGDGEVYATMRVLSWRLKLETRQAQATLACMASEKLIVHEDFLTDGRYYGITPAGALFIYPKTVLRTFSKGKTSNSNLLHHSLTQFVRVQLELFYGIKGWESEKFLINRHQFPNVPDGVFVTDTLAIAAEIELTPKTIDDQKKVLKVYCEILSEKPDAGTLVNRVIYFTPHVNLMVERINSAVPDEYKHLFFVQFLAPVVVPYKRGSYLVNNDLANFIGNTL